MIEQLALLGGKPAVSIPRPHEIWPPPASQVELEDIAEQRNRDISIKGKSGPIKDFEEAFKGFLEDKIKFTVSFNSGTSALLAAYFAVGIDAGDEIIGPCLTFHAALSPVYLLRAVPVLVDIDINNRCIDPTKIEERITSKTKAITVVHQWGHPAEMDAIMPIAQKYGLKVIEDCSHAHGSRYKGRLCGTFGDVAVFSLQANKALFAGEGGILVTNSSMYHDRATLLGHYRDRSKDEIVDPNLQKYWVTGFGLKLRMSPFNAIVAKHSLNHFPLVKLGRHTCLKYFIQRLKEVEFIEPPFIADNVDMGGWYGFKPLYKQERLGGISRNLLIAALKAEGMEVDAPSAPVLSTLPLYNDEYSPLFPLHRQSLSPQTQVNFPIGTQVENEALSLPTFYDWEVHKPIIDQYIDAFKKVAHFKDALLELADSRTL